MAPGVANKWALNTTNLPAGDLGMLKSHLLRGLPAIMGCPNSVDLVSDGGLPHQKTTKSGLELSVRVLDNDGIEWAREVMRSGRIFFTRNGLNHPLLSTATRYFPLIDASSWKDHLLVTIPGEVLQDSESPQDNEESISPPVLPAPVLIGGTLGTIAGSMMYGGPNHWIRPIGLISAGLFSVCLKRLLIRLCLPRRRLFST